MSSWLSEREKRLVEGAEGLEFDSPVPTQIVSNGEYLPPKLLDRLRRIVWQVSVRHEPAEESPQHDEATVDGRHGPRVDSSSLIPEVGRITDGHPCDDERLPV